MQSKHIDTAAEAKQALLSTLRDTLEDIKSVRLRPTINETDGAARAEYLRGRVAAARVKLTALRRLQKREREVQARRREIKRENDAHHKHKQQS